MAYRQAANWGGVLWCRFRLGSSGSLMERNALASPSTAGEGFFFFYRLFGGACASQSGDGRKRCGGWRERNGDGGGGSNVEGGLKLQQRPDGGCEDSR